MKFKFGVKQIVLTIVAVLLVGILIGGNIILDANKGLLHTLFSSMTGGGQPKGESYAMGDALVSQLVEDSAVLLRNEDGALPLDSSDEGEKKVNLFGWNATTDGFLLTGVGSGGSPVLDENRVTLAQAFKDEGYEYNETLYNDYANNSGANGDKINKYGQYASDAMKAIHNPDASFYTADRMNAARAYSDVAIIVLSRNTGENCGNGETLNVSGTNYTNGAWLELTANEQVMLEKVTQTFADGKVIVLLNTTNTMELGFLEQYDVDAALYIGAVGQSGARAIPHLLYGEKPVKDDDGKVVTDDAGNKVVDKISPSGRTADTYAYNYNLVNGKAYSASWASTLSNSNSLYYQEGIYLGYKWYETAAVEGFFEEAGGYDAIVQYPFGYGLSYTTFEWKVKWPTEKELTIDGKYTVEVTVKNTGDHPGKDVVELYYTPHYTNGGIEKAEMNLLAFGKTVTLNPGESQPVTLEFSAYDLASYDDYDKNGNGFKGYELENGDYVLKLMTDAHHAATCANNTYTLNNKSTILIENDPVTGTKVENQFTGSTAYSGTPIDGSTAFAGGIDYLSRENGFENFPKTTSNQCAARSSSPSQTYAATAWNNADVSDIDYGKDSQLYLVTKSDGTKASANELDSSDDLVFNTELMEDLWDYESDTWTLFLNQLTQSDINMLIGQGQFKTETIASIGKPYCKEYDGPSGFNRNSVAGAKSDPSWVVFPVEILLGCSWNQEATYNMGKAMGVIANETGIHGWYGPGLNLHRSAYYGRNFEYYSEDAVLTGKLAAQCIKGAKEQNLVCYMKHFVCADTGPNSPNWYTWLTEQNLRENYLRPFEIAVKEGGANAAMSGFSAVGATWAGSNYAINIQVLRNEWGFRGSVVTDWQNSYMDKTRGILGGNDLWLGNDKANFTYSDTAQAYCARQSAKNILYTYVDCYMTAYKYDPSSATGPIGGGADYSPLFAALWAIIDILLILGTATCVLFILGPKQIAYWVKGNKAATAETAEGVQPDSEVPPTEPEDTESEQ